MPKKPKPKPPKRYKPIKNYAAYIKHLKIRAEVVQIDFEHKEVVVRIPEFRYQTCEYDFDFDQIILLEETKDEKGKIVYKETDIR